jgi:capsular polysaccharide biosynthesis protein
MRRHLIDTHTILPVPINPSTGIAAAVALLPGARVAVGVHGANVANAVFCGEGAALVEIALWEPEVFQRNACMSVPCLAA